MRAAPFAKFMGSEINFVPQARERRVPSNKENSRTAASQNGGLIADSVRFKLSRRKLRDGRKVICMRICICSVLATTPNSEQKLSRQKNGVTGSGSVTQSWPKNKASGAGLAAAQRVGTLRCA